MLRRFVHALILLTFASSKVGFAFEYTHKRCEAKEYAGVVLPYGIGCAPEVLYAWKDKDTVARYIQESSSTDFLPAKSEIWAWRTPIGTFGYGDFVVRMKLRPHTHFKMRDVWTKDGGCSSLTASEKNHTVIFGYYKAGHNFSEYIICSPNVVESWSVQTPEIYNEMVKEYNWVEQRRDDVTLYDRLYRTVSTPTWTDTDYNPKSYFFFNLDQYDWSKDKLLENFDRMKNLLDTSFKGYVFYGPQVPKNRARHYHVNYPDYFN